MYPLGHSLSSSAAPRFSRAALALWLVLALVVPAPALASVTGALPQKAPVVAVAAAPSALVNLDISQTGPLDPVDVGGAIDYTLTATNLATGGTASSVRVTDTLPAGTTFVGASSQCSLAGALVLCSLGYMRPGVQTQITLTVSAPLATGWITNTARIGSPDTDMDQLNNESQLGTEVLEEPVTMFSGALDSYTIADNKIYWHQPSTCVTGPQAGGPEAAGASIETVGRVATYGSTNRQLNVGNLVCTSPSAVLSNIVGDNQYAYWTTAAGLVKLPALSNAGDQPALVTSVFAGKAELAQDATFVFALVKVGDITQVWKVKKSNGVPTKLSDQVGTATTIAADGQYVYWLLGGVLQRLPVGGGIPKNLDSVVDGYHPDGLRNGKSYVYIGRYGKIRRYENVSETLDSSYLWASADSTAQVYSIASDATDVYFLEKNPVWNRDNVRRLHLADLKSGVLSHVPDYSPTLQTAHNVSIDANYVFWLQNGQLKRVDKWYDLVDKPDLDITSMQITQSVQNTANSVMLIQGRRTFVRVFAKSIGPNAKSVSGVTAQLSATWTGGSGGPLLPINDGGGALTVHTSVDKYALNGSFVFEIPISWTKKSGLKLHAVLNPYHSPPETAYGNNSYWSPELYFWQSPSLAVTFVGYNYSQDWGQSWYMPRYDKDVLQTYSWILRAYPVAFNTTGAASTPGFHPSYMNVYDPQFYFYVYQYSPLCYLWYPDSSLRDLCGSKYTNFQMAVMRLQYGIPFNRFMYSLINTHKWVRGQAGDGNVSSGPAGSMCCGAAWDTDGAITDWYAGHEIGHSLGRMHPVPNSDNPDTAATEGCGHSRDDASYPYSKATIGPSGSNAHSGWLDGFDAGDPAFGIPMQVLKGTQWHDVMTYCDYQWPGDYTYTSMYFYMTMPHVSAPEPAAPQTGDWLSVAGTIITGTQQATINFVRRLPSAVVPPPADGPYHIQLLGTGDGVLADYAFAPATAEEVTPPQATFVQAVPFAPNTVAVRIVAGRQELARADVSPHAPVVSSVTVQQQASLPAAGGGVLRLPVESRATPNMATSQATAPGGSSVSGGSGAFASLLRSGDAAVSANTPDTAGYLITWAATDQDAGDTLQYDVLYSRDGGVTFRPLGVNLSDQSLAVPAANLAGPSGIIRVVASDGSQSGQANSAAFSVPVLPPQVSILSPGNGSHFEWGQLVTLSGEADDPQDGVPDDAAFVWSDSRGSLGVGSTLSSDVLPVGQDVITLTVTNSQGLSASASVTIDVGDSLALPGPTLIAGPASAGWQVDAGETQAQTAELSIDNSGSGTITWAASSDAAWLTPSQLTGSTPFTLTVTAAVAGMPAGTIHDATLTLTGSAAGQPDQVIAIPVHLAVGDVHALLPPQKVYLPVVTK